MNNQSFSGYETTATEPLSREFTEVSLVQETEAHQFYRAKRYGRWYLLKALPPARRASEFHQQMLQKEMEILMQLQHPNIVSCLGMEHLPDYTDSNGLLVSVGTCIILEYIDGRTLAELIKDHSSLATLQYSFVNELLDALAYLHASGITHRDLKPTNIMLTHHGQHVKLIDFSLADTDSHAILKQPSGTRSYMAPEQATATTPDPRNDIYSLGVILSELPLKGFWPVIARRCQLPIDERYPSIEALQADIAVRRQRRSRLRWAAVFCIPVLLFLAIGAVVNHIYQEQNRIPRITAQALEQLEDSIAATQLVAHLDTLSHWRYLDPQVNEKILSVNAFIYDYADSNLGECNEYERNDILCQMLDRWQQWHDQVVRQVKYLMQYAP